LIACLGFECKASTLCKINIFADIDLMAREMLLKILTNEGMLSLVGAGLYRFPHDKVHQAAYQLIPPCDRAGLHLDIGRQLRGKCLTAAELDSMIFTIVDQLSRGLDLVTDHNEKVDIARLCLVAGKKAMAKSSVGPAAIYHLQGSALLQESDWFSQYDLVRNYVPAVLVFLRFVDFVLFLSQPCFDWSLRCCCVPHRASQNSRWSSSPAVWRLSTQPATTMAFTYHTKP
jgi:predicted ATPase